MSEGIFRTILILGFVMVLPVVAYYRIRSQATREKLDRRQEGLLLLVCIRLFGVLGVAGLLAFLLNPNTMAWSRVPLPLWARWSGVGLGVLGAALLVWTFHHLGKNLTDTVVTRKNHTLVTSGPYQWVRHPFYVAFALIILANALTAANWFLLVTGGIAFLLLVARTRIEEQKLVERFGDAYRDYMRRTGRFFPRRGTGSSENIR